MDDQLHKLLNNPRMAAAVMGGLSIGGMLPYLMGDDMDDEEQKLQQACDEADREAQYLLRVVEGHKRILKSYERGLEIFVKQTLPCSELENVVQRAIWSANIESARQLVAISIEDHTAAETEWKKAAESLLQFRNEKEFRRQEEARAYKAEDEAIAMRLLNGDED